MDRIHSGSFVELKELLPDNVTLLQWLQGTSTASQARASVPSHLHDIRDPLAWGACFLSFVAARVDHREIQEMKAYGQIILQLAKTWGAWLNFMTACQ